jgi:hypothetical protein
VCLAEIGWPKRYPPYIRQRRERSGTGRRAAPPRAHVADGGSMQRLSAEGFIAEVLHELQDLSPDLRKRLLEAVRLSPAIRVREIEKVFQETARG